MRALRILLIFVVIIGGLFVAADRLALHYAEGKVADRIQSSQNLATKPDVSVKGFPFLTQVAGKSLDEVDVGLGRLNATANGHTVHVTDVEAVLRDVRIDSSFSSATAGTAEGSARISYADLAAAVPQGATVSYAGPERAAKGQVKVVAKVTDVMQAENIPDPSGLVTKLVGDKTLTAYGTVTMVKGDDLRLRFDDISGLPVPGLADQIKGLINDDLKIDGLPSTVTLSKVAVSGTGLSFSGTGTNVALTG
ncbi:LmeA family phospholipid-binding protein [Streptomyces fuscigenes]|uniref:LmeA family phospholipid-binding protein n=1 Tax=Streptomyces fuscigenes TaxID=1528880 RepID=UPI001F3E1775|nr:DUF2993 domain-containing protein [Streptomyces fuscigenes]MCF3964504.1 DUF2993 domain-containing protein [Streptomyces fuscigenes]